jgi:hypothetical protein
MASPSPHRGLSRPASAPHGPAPGMLTLALARPETNVRPRTSVNRATADEAPKSRDNPQRIRAVSLSALTVDAPSSMLLVSPSLEPRGAQRGNARRFQAFRAVAGSPEAPPTAAHCLSGLLARLLLDLPGGDRGCIDCCWNIDLLGVLGFWKVERFPLLTAWRGVMVLFLGLWSALNMRYFRKRRHLFEAKTDSTDAKAP